MTATAVAIDWNAWRRDYDSLTFDEQQALYDRIYCEFPEQARAKASALLRLLTYLDRPLTVIELGGWTGGLAADVLPLRPEIVWWTNYEISRAAVAESVCQDPRYSASVLEDWYWQEPHFGDLFVASHVLEHLSVLDVLATFDATDASWLYLQAPLDGGPTDWTDYRGTHILQVGWTAIEQVLAERGYALLPAFCEPHVRCFERREDA